MLMLQRGFPKFRASVRDALLVIVLKRPSPSKSSSVHQAQCNAISYHPAWGHPWCRNSQYPSRFVVKELPMSSQHVEYIHGASGASQCHPNVKSSVAVKKRALCACQKHLNNPGPLPQKPCTLDGNMLQVNPRVPFTPQPSQSSIPCDIPQFPAFLPFHQVSVPHLDLLPSPSSLQGPASVELVF
ncbi:hypothetical protein PMIN04_006546 [Paraphaeosphaeria minitans]